MEIEDGGVRAYQTNYWSVLPYLDYFRMSAGVHIPWGDITQPFGVTLVVIAHSVSVGTVRTSILLSPKVSALTIARRCT